MDVADIDALTAEVIAGTNDAGFDVTGDGLVNQLDRTEWISNLRGTFLGDANLDDEFGSSDLVVVFRANVYEDETAGNAIWATGDWNGDGDFSTILYPLFWRVLVNKDRNRPSSSVPEPTTVSLAVFAILSAYCIAPLRKRRCA